MTAGGNADLPFQQRFSSMLRPRSLAIVGASGKSGSVGYELYRVLRSGGFAGTISLVNPNYEQIEGQRCFPVLSSLPAPPDLAVLCVAGTRIEPIVDDAIEAKVGSVLIFDSCTLEGDSQPSLVNRLKEKAKAAGLPVCGGNGMGFYNFDWNAHVSYVPPLDRPAGHIALIAHSGSAFLSLLGNDLRYRFNMAVSPGQEINGTMADYIDFALEQPTTKVVALFMEAAREPGRFVQALDKAQQRRIPIVVLKVGRTAASAALAATHCGAIAGNDAAYDAVFRRYGVLRVETLDQLMATSLLMAHSSSFGEGGLSAITDSGGLRELIVDLAEKYQVRLAQFGEQTIGELRQRLPFGLDPANPLDAGGPLGPDYVDTFRDCLKIMMEDPDTAIGSYEFVMNDEVAYMPELLDVATEVRSYTGKPFIVLNSFGAADNQRMAGDLLNAGVPLINGTDSMLVAVRHAFAYRDFLKRPSWTSPEGPCLASVNLWRERLRRRENLDEVESLSLISEFGVPVVDTLICESEDEVRLHAGNLRFPIVIKTAQPDIPHKTDVGGVVLNVGTLDMLISAYRDLSRRLGSRVVIAPMMKAGVELAFGAVMDDQFGPIVMVASGGILVETLQDRQFSVAPFSVEEARYLLDRLKIRSLLEGKRGFAAANMDSVVQALANFSVLAAELKEELLEIDVNPVIVTPQGAIAVDALVVGRGSIGREPAAERVPIKGRVAADLR